MRRWLTHTPYHSALLLILILALSLVVILPAKSPSTTTNLDTRRVVSMLEWLRGNVTDLGNEAFGDTSSANGHRTALGNKINATIHQIEAYNKSGNKTRLSGLLNKLQNDVNKTVTEWIYPYSPLDAETLFDLILEIIKLIRGIAPAPPPAPPVPDFSILALPTNLTIQQGSSDASIIIITSLGGFDQSVNLAVTSEPIASITLDLNPSQVTPLPSEPATSTLTVEVAETAVPGTYTITVTGISDPLRHSRNLTLTVTTAPPPPDLEPPTVRIDKPANGSYLAGLVNIIVFMYDEKLERAELTINNTRIASWTPENVSTGVHSISWDTTLPEYPDGLYNITFSAEDKAGNPPGKKTHIVTVDNTKPTATIDAPAEESYLRSSVLIRVTGEDKNFYKMNLKIDNVSVKNWTTGGSQIYEWDTNRYLDGSHNITLTVYDKAGNGEEISITTFVDNTRPTIEAPTWKPQEPSVDTQVNITVKVSDSQPSSGIQNVTLWYRNRTMNDWQPIPMSLNVTSWNWTATIPAQSIETQIKFYIEAFDNAGNKAVTDKIHKYKVTVSAGLPLAWIVAIVLLILAATAVAIYLWRKRRIEEESISSDRVKNYKLTILMCL